MSRKFVHRFQPLEEAPPGAGEEVELTVQEIEAAGYQEMLQTSGARLTSWSILDALLQQGIPAFVFKQPLGIAREVKVAASGLFGRFVARAYLTRYMGLSFFGHLGSKKIKLNTNQDLEISRKKGMKGDLPDWVACSAALAKLTVAEAKGCHDSAGPETRLKHAWNQAQRVDVLADQKRLTVKRIAIVTRWASAVDGAKTPIIAVRDPVDYGDPDTSSKLDDVAIGLARLHVANLLEPLGFEQLAQAIRSLLVRKRWRLRDSATISGSRGQDALADLRQIRPRHVVGEVRGPRYEGEGLIGSLLTRAGPVTQREIPITTVQGLHQLGLQPTFVGIERDVLEAVIKGDPEQIRRTTGRQRGSADPEFSIDPVGTWLVRVGQRIHVR